MCTQWKRTIAGGTILFQVFKETINSLKKSMCKILLIKTKQNSYQCSLDFTNKVGSRTGDATAAGGPFQRSSGTPSHACSWTGWEQRDRSERYRRRGQKGGGTSDPSWVTLEATESPRRNEVLPGRARPMQ